MNPYLQQIYNQAYQDTMVKLATAAQEPITAQADGSGKFNLAPDTQNLLRDLSQNKDLRAQAAQEDPMSALLSSMGMYKDVAGTIKPVPQLGSAEAQALLGGFGAAPELVGAKPKDKGNYSAARKSLEDEPARKAKELEDHAKLMKILEQAGIIGGAGLAGAGIGAAVSKGKRGRGAIGGGLGAMLGAGAGEVANAYLGDMLKQKTGLDPNVLRGILSGGGAALGTAGGIALA